MTRKIVIIESAKEEFKDIKIYVKRQFGGSTWNTVNAEFKAAFERIKQNPEVGSHIDELKELGITNIKYMLVRQTKVVYEFDDTFVLVHVLINTKRDFRTHLFKRLLSQ